MASTSSGCHAPVRLSRVADIPLTERRGPQPLPNRGGDAVIGVSGSQATPLLLLPPGSRDPGNPPPCCKEAQPAHGGRPHVGGTEAANHELASSSRHQEPFMTLPPRCLGVSKMSPHPSRLPQQLLVWHSSSLGPASPHVSCAWATPAASFHSVQLPRLPGEGTGQGCATGCIRPSWPRGR